MTCRFGSEDAQRRPGDEMALKVERVVDGGVHTEKALGGCSRFEPLHLALSPSHDLMRVLSLIVHPEPLLMAAGQMEIPEGGAVGPQLVGHNQPGREALLSEKFAHQLRGSPPVSPRLDQDIEDLALVIDGAPQIHSPSSDAHDHLVQMPPVVRRGRRCRSRRAITEPNFRTQRRIVS
jgi:hypothetical protein